MSKMLITSVDMGCSNEVLSIIAMLSAENIFYRPRDRQAQADQRKARFTAPEGDHLTLVRDGRELACVATTLGLSLPCAGADLVPRPSCS